MTILCVPNISEGRRRDAIEGVADAAGAVAGVEMLSIHSDVDHNRSILTFRGAPGAAAEAAFRCVAEASRRIDISRHEGVHPRFGAADVVPFVPAGEPSASLARALAERVRAELAIPTYVYGLGATLPEVRRTAAEFHPTAGAVAVGVRDILIAYNVNLETTDLAAAKAIAAAVREPDVVRALGLPLPSRGCVQVSMNLLDYRETSPRDAFRKVAALARERGLDVRESEVAGMIPRAAVAPGFVAAARCRPLEVLDDFSG